MRYNVHIFAVVRVKVSDVEARSHADAVGKAEQRADLYRLFDSAYMSYHVSLCGASEAEFADELSGRMAYLVDEAGDSGWSRSRCFDGNRKQIPVRPGLR